MDRLFLEGIPFNLYCEHSPVELKIEDGRVLTITSGKHTDLFINIMDDIPINNSPRLMFTTDEDFILSTKVEVKFNTVYDGGALVLFSNERLWAKLCLEYSIYKRPFIASVVTCEHPDDCNSGFVDKEEVYLRASKIGGRIIFHYSLDGKGGQFVRHFTLGDVSVISVGFASQSPEGESCTSIFSEIDFKLEKLRDIGS